jgi:uncharacterized protein (TIGR00266 family)
MQYKIQGTPMPVVVCNLEQGETMITEKGSMAWMSPNVQMDTTTGGIGKAFGRIFSGDSFFQNRFTATGGRGIIAFASSFPGEIRAFDIAPGHSMIVQKAAFLAATQGVELSVYFQKRISAGFFGGEGFILQRLSGSGTAFVEFDGSIVEYELAPGQSIVIDSGYLAAMSDTCTMEIQMVKGLKNMVFGGEGLFNTVVTGPGKVMLQTMPLSAVAGAIYSVFPNEK